ncbi:MAG: type 4a pilus biogenesis protein PilO [Polyangiaceae bacterium]|nr:type 4a pilus biogenesis protein PilO [Polyangiaceae bacterium]
MAKQSPLAKLPAAAKFGVGGLLIVLTALVYFIVFFSDLDTSVSSAQNKETKLRSDLAGARAAEHAYQKDLAELADREQRQRDLNKILPATTEYPAFLSAIQAVSNSAGITLLSWSPSKEVSGPYYAKVPMKLVIKGRYHQIAKFFYNVGQLDRIINMENITVGKPDITGDEVKLNVSVLATAFHSGVKKKKKKKGAR